MPGLEPLGAHPLRRRRRRRRGVVTDVAGFAAAVYHRGRRRPRRLPCSAWSSCDGGKTGVNLPEGKNLVGVLAAPSAWCATSTPWPRCRRELRSGHGELAKYHFLTDADLDALDLEDRVAAAVAIKAEVVAADEREGSRRAILNYGPHTLAQPSRPAAVRAAPRRGGCHRARLRRRAGPPTGAHRRRAGRAALARSAATTCSTSPPPGSDAAELVALMGRDKKALDGLTFALDGPGASRSSPASTRRWPTRPWRTCSRDRSGPAPVGTELDLLGIREPRSTARSPSTTTSPRSATRFGDGWEVSHLQSNHEGELVDAIRGRQGAPRRHRHQRRRAHPLRLVDP